jgi:hypothetical protein
MIQVQTRWDGDKMRFIKCDGTSVAFDNEFDYNGKSYYFLGGFYYDLELSLIDHLFGD